MKRVILLIVGLLIISLPFTWPYLVGFVTGIHHTCIEDFDSKKMGLAKHSLTIEESKEKRVFVSSLKSDKRTIDLDSKGQIAVENIWIEKLWKYECLDTALTVVPLQPLAILIEVDDYKSLYENGNKIKYGDKVAGFSSGILWISANVLSGDTLLLTVVGRDGTVTDELRLTR
jgi:hypothetical protein